MYLKRSNCRRTCTLPMFRFELRRSCHRWLFGFHLIHVKFEDLSCRRPSRSTETSMGCYCFRPTRQHYFTLDRPGWYFATRIKKSLFPFCKAMHESKNKTADAKCWRTEKKVNTPHSFLLCTLHRSASSIFRMDTWLFSKQSTKNPTLPVPLTQRQSKFWIFQYLFSSGLNLKIQQIIPCASLRLFGTENYFSLCPLRN